MIIKKLLGLLLLFSVAVIDPAQDIIKGSDFDYYLINNGAALHDEQMNGFGLSTPDAPGVSFDRPGLWKYTCGVSWATKTNSH